MFDTIGGAAIGDQEETTNVTIQATIPAIEARVTFGVESRAFLGIRIPAVVSQIVVSTPAPPGQFSCPSLLESIGATLALLPRGRAWPANDGGTTLANYWNWLKSLRGKVPARDAWQPGFVQTGYFAAVGAARNYLERRLCDLRFEFWCATHSETHDVWMEEYGLPDACDPFPDLCSKVSALGGARCEYYSEIAARAGWAIECLDGDTSCGSFAGCAVAGCDLTGASYEPNKLQIVVHLNDSPAFVSIDESPSLAGCMMAGMNLTCPPDITGVQCLIERIVSAHVEVKYLTA